MANQWIEFRVEGVSSMKDPTWERLAELQREIHAEIKRYRNTVSVEKFQTMIIKVEDRLADEDIKRQKRYNTGARAKAGVELLSTLDKGDRAKAVMELFASIQDETVRAKVAADLLGVSQEELAAILKHRQGGK